MESLRQPEQFRLRELDEVVVPVERGRFVIKADFEKFKKRVVAPLSLSDEVKTNLMNNWTVKNLHLEPMRAYMNKIFKESPWKMRLQQKLGNLLFSPIGTVVGGGHINVDVAKIIHTIDGLQEQFTDEEKEMLVKQTIDSVLRHEEEHLRQWMVKDDETSTKVHGESVQRYKKLNALASGGLVAGMTGEVASVLLMGYQRIRITKDAQAAQHILQQLSQSQVSQDIMQTLAQSSQTDTLRTVATILGVASFATASGSIALYCLNHRSYKNFPWEQAAEEQEKPQYFSEKSPLEVSFERYAQQGNIGSF